jgi:signal transduction histidine kinase
MNLSDEIAPVGTISPLRPALTDIPRSRTAASSKVVRVLVLDDNEDDFAYVKILLGKSFLCTYQVEWVQTEAAALEALQRGDFDVALFDYKLGGTTGLEILQTLQSQSCDIPIILLTGSENPAVDQAALTAGAADYLCKGSLDTTRLERAIRYSISHAQMLSALRESQAQLQLFMRSVPCAVCIYDEKGEILFQNEIFKRHFTVQAVIAARKLASGASGPTQYSHGNRHWLITTFPMVERSGRNLQGLAGIDITQRRLVERELLRVSDAEKNRIGSDLHDGLGQYLTGISCLSAALRDKLQVQNRAEAEDAATISSLVQEAIAQTRALARGLCPVQLETSGLETALEDLTFQVQRLHGLDCQFEPTGTIDVETSVALHIYRIAQEAINNAIKHASAKRIVVRADFSQENKLLVIEDDGCGFDPNVQHGPSSGMSMMPYRAAMIGGTLTVTSKPNAGTKVECRFVYPL